MADDVKVKFGGDFSQVSKDANAAGKSAGNTLGTKLSESLSSFGTSMAAKIGGLFAIDAIFERLKEGFMDARQYFGELDDALRATGASSEELQRVAGLAKSVGISFNVVGKSIGIFSKYMGNAAKDAKGHGKLLRELGFSNDEISNGSIKATDVLAALATQLKETGDENIAAANAAAIFGRGGREMLPIIQKGSSAILEQAEAVKIYSEAELQAAEAAERAAERRTSSWKKFFRWVSLSMDEHTTKQVVMDTGLEVSKELQAKGVNLNTPEGKAQQQAEVIKRLQGKGVGFEAQKAAFDTIRKELGNSPGTSNELRSQIDVEFAEMIAAINKASEEAEAKTPSTGSDESGVSAMAVSSLQSIGGGDINSILSGTYNETMLDAAKRTADNTQKIADKDPAVRPTLTVTK